MIKSETFGSMKFGGKVYVNMQPYGHPIMKLLI